MFKNHRRNFFLAIVVILVLLFTDSTVEQSAEQLFVSKTGLNMSGNQGIFDMLDSLRQWFDVGVSDLSTYVLIASQNASGVVYVFWNLVKWAVSLLGVVVSNFYIFYAAVACLLYFLLTSRLFKNHYDY